MLHHNNQTCVKMLGRPVLMSINTLYLDKPTLTCDAHSHIDPIEGDTRQIECTSTPANPEPVLSVYTGDVVVKSVKGRTLTYSVEITRAINGVQFKCTATSSDATKYDYSVSDEPKSYHVLCE